MMIAAPHRGIGEHGRQGGGGGDEDHLGLEPHLLLLRLRPDGSAWLLLLLPGPGL